MNRPSSSQRRHSTPSRSGSPSMGQQFGRNRPPIRGMGGQYGAMNRGRRNGQFGPRSRQMGRSGQQMHRIRPQQRIIEPIEGMALFEFARQSAIAMIILLPVVIYSAIRLTRKQDKGQLSTQDKIFFALYLFCILFLFMVYLGKKLSTPQYGPRFNQNRSRTARSGQRPNGQRGLREQSSRGFASNPPVYRSRSNSAFSSSGGNNRFKQSF